MASTAPHVLDLDAWAQTAIGEPRSWPPALRTAAEMCLAYPTACALLWGDSARLFYNSAMANGIGTRHPTAMAQPLYEVMPSVWRTVGPIVHEVVRTAQSFSATRFPVQADLGERVAQYYIDFSLVPVCENDQVVGVFAPIGDSTRTHLEVQRHAALTAVATVPTGLSRDEVASAVARHLVESDDVRFTVIFLRDRVSGALVRTATGGAALRPASTLAALDVAVTLDLWPLEQVLADRRAPERVQGAPRGSRVSRPLWEDAWLVALPSPVDGVLVVGLDNRFVVPGGPQEYVARLAAAAGERLGR